jgi:hypothetical protein
MAEPSPVVIPPRRRPLLALPSWVLAICLVLPTLRVCGSPATPLELPPVYVVYLGAVVIGFVAWSRRRRLRQLGIKILASLWFATGALLLAIWLASINSRLGVLAALAALAAVVVVVRAIARTAPSERTIMISCLTHAVIALGWNALLAFDPQAMWGAYLGFGASLAMVTASIAALAGEALIAARRRRAARPAPLPLARIFIE